MAEISPFAALHTSHVEQILASCPELGLSLMQFDKDRKIRFCRDHILLDAQAKSTWRLHAALIHLMLQPLVQTYKRACKVASTALCDYRPRELELAFRGHARHSFVWLQCLMSEEKAWCTKIACPACSATYTLSNESTIRAIITAALLSNSANCPEGSPNFSPILQALEIAILNDPFWNSMHYPHFLSRSKPVTAGIEDLRQQCTELVILMTSPPGSNSSVTSGSSVASCSDDGSDCGSAPLFLRQPSSLIRMEPGSVALRQMSLRQEQMLAVAGMLSKWTAMNDMEN